VANAKKTLLFSNPNLSWGLLHTSPTRALAPSIKTELIMNRKQFLKNIFASAALLLLPTSFLLAEKKEKLKPKKQLHFVGLGGGGCNAAEFIQQRMLDAKFTCITSPIRKYKNDEIKFVELDLQEWFDMPIIRKNYLNDEIFFRGIENVEEVFRTNDTFIILVGAGGDTGTMIAHDVFERMRGNNRDCYMIATFPFDFEGRSRIRMASKFVERFKFDNHFCLVRSEEMRKIYGDMDIADAFEKIDEMMMDKALELAKKI
jgi:cell division protein FtsZ